MPSVSPLNRVNDTPSTARTRSGFAGAVDREMLRQIARDQQRLRRAAAVARIVRRSVECHAHSRTSMAARMPSLTRLKQIEVMKIADAGQRADQRLDIDRLAQRAQHQAPIGGRRLHAKAEERQAGRQQDADADTRLEA